MSPWSPPPPRETPGVFRAPGGVVVHLYLPGYVQGKKDRRPPDQGMCAAATTRAVWIDPVPSPRPRQPLRWCPKCLGLAMAKFGLLDQAVEAITPFFRYNTQLPPGATQRDGESGSRVADPQRMSGGRQQPGELVPVAPIAEERGGAGSAPAPPAGVLGGCPRGMCQHAGAVHDWDGEPETWICCVDGCPCGKAIL